MAHAFTPGLKVAREVVVRKLRELPVAGEILVTRGSGVTAEQVVGRAYLSGELHILRIPEKMGIEPFEVMRGLKVKEGEAVSVGKELCEHAGFFGLFKSRFESPVEGTIEFIAERTGHVGVRVAPTPIELPAYVSGTVVDVHPGKSLVIESVGAFVQGIFGVGGERQGELLVLDVADDKPLEVGDLPLSIKGKIVVGGTRPSAEALSYAAIAGAVGLVVGALDDLALHEFLGYDIGIALTGDEDISMTVIATEGFGSIPLSARVRELLGTLQGRKASINGATQVRAGALRPEIIVPSAQSTRGASEESQSVGLEVGSVVRLIRVPYFGSRGTVTELPHEMERLPTGAFARVLRAELADGSVVTVPRANVELAE